MAGQEDSIEVVAATRKEMIRALRAAQELSNTPDEDSAHINNNTDDDNDASEETNMSVKFRNYFPRDKKLMEGKLKIGPILKFDDPIAAVVPFPSEKKKDPFKDLVPKPPHFELQRDVQKRLDKLERRTQKALCKIMEQERLKQENEGGINGLS
ncbi:putative mRNA splicing factor, Cwf18 [Rosa chinensis]|uniref:Putative mRNA splicing factor, Cwf18 n=1 Tax=Rosa chinensis TaxID=74649 RepID=A0A2P6Q3H4_ROSCH|nr:coiled-coil domain-containing protein 12 [Rosa chinensis]PRQ28735.1 putative mRNA splicing factor, Cwf18 [Rosa chinensis]